MIDAHCHLNDSKLKENIKTIYDEALKNGFKALLCASWNIESSKEANAISGQFEKVYSGVGISPQEVDDFSLKDINKIEELINDKTVAIAEIGLDYHYTDHNSEKQKAFLLSQLRLSKKYNLPVCIHMRDTTKDFIDIIKEYRIEDAREILGMMHSFSGSVETMNELLKLGFYISFSGPVTFKNAKDQKECAIHCPLDRILVETDSPYLSPEPLRGTMNVPSNAIYTLREIAKLKEIDAKELENIVEDNFSKLFKRGI